jgi:HK97 family phage major capsid protein
MNLPSAGRPFQGIAVPMSVFNVPLEKRVVTGAGEGSNLIGTDLRGDEFINALYAKLVVRRLGARVLTGLVGNVDIPKLVDSVVSGWVADNSALSLDDPDLSKVQLTPKTCGALTEFSRNTLLQSSPDIEQLLRMDFAKVLAVAMDAVAINGGGSNEPSGILQSGLTTVSFGSGPTWSKVLELIETVQENNTEGNAWVTTPGVVRLLRSTVRVASTDSVMIMESANSLADYPVAVTQNAPRTLGSPQTGDALIFGDFTDLLLAFWSELDILVNPYESTAYSKGNVQIRGMMTADVAVRHSQSFAASTDVQPG